MDYDASCGCRRLRLARLVHRRGLVRSTRHPGKGGKVPGSGLHAEEINGNALAWAAEGTCANNVGTIRISFFKTWPSHRRRKADQGPRNRIGRFKLAAGQSGGGNPRGESSECHRFTHSGDIRTS